jgi:NADPH:quinone reductase-like Zn-dependent oxidoreductase
MPAYVIQSRISSQCTRWNVAVAVLLLSCLAGSLQAAPAEQNAIVQAGTGGAEALVYKQVPVLQPGEGQVRIKVYAAAINPIDWKSRSGMMGGPRPAGGTPSEGKPTATAPSAQNTRIPGSDVAGVIDAVGAGVTQFKVGDAVFATIGRGGGAPVNGLNGGYAEYAIASVPSVITKPKSMTFAEASGLGTATITAVNAINRAQVKAGQRVLITGAAGGVGSAAVQLAKARGAYVIAVAAGKHTAYLKKIGADELLDYKQVAWDEKAHDVDAVLDNVSGENALKALKTMKKGGVLVSMVGRLESAPECTAAGVDCGGPSGAPASPAANQSVGMDAGMGAGGPPSTPTSESLAEVVKLANAGKFAINVDATFPLAKAFDAQEENRNGGTQGKIVLAVDPAKAGQK